MTIEFWQTFIYLIISIMFFVMSAIGIQLYHSKSPKKWQRILGLVSRVIFGLYAVLILGLFAFLLIVGFGVGGFVIFVIFFNILAVLMPKMGGW